MKIKFNYLLFLVLVVILISKIQVEGQDESSCVNQLVVCLNYLNNNQDPPDSCCDPLKRVLKSDPKCLCRMVSIKGTQQAQRAGINVTQAQTLPGRCGQHVNPISCLTTGSSQSNSKNSVQHTGVASTLPSLSLLVPIALWTTFHFFV